MKITRQGLAALLAALVLMGASACQDGATEPQAAPDGPAWDCGPGITGGGGKQDSTVNCTRTSAP